LLKPSRAPAEQSRKAAKPRLHAVKKAAAKTNRKARGKARKPTTAAKRKRAKRR
jgi:hypothetical protein